MVIKDLLEDEDDLLPSGVDFLPSSGLTLYGLLFRTVLLSCRPIGFCF